MNTLLRNNEYMMEYNEKFQSIFAYILYYLE